MATAGDFGARDERADENTDLARKRQRISEETEVSPLSSIVEALPPGAGGTSVHPPELEDETGMAASSYTAAFTLEDGSTSSPVQQLQSVGRGLRNSNYIDASDFENLSIWLEGHLKSTKDDPRAVWQEKYLFDAEFFDNLAQLSFSILSHGGEFFGHFPDDVLTRLGQRVVSFVHDITSLSTRMLFVLPQAIEQTVSRRDSGPVKSGQTVLLLAYVQVLAQILGLHRANFDYFKDTFHLMPSGTATTLRRDFLQTPGRVSALTTVLHELSKHIETISGWHGIDAILLIMAMLCADDGMAAIDGTCLHQTLVIIQDQLLPIVCKTNPRALPPDFHGLLVTTACRLLATLARDADIHQAASLYDKYIKADSDALLDALPADSTAAGLKDLSNGCPAVLQGLLTTAYNLQALRLYIISDIMGVCSVGIGKLSFLLQQLYISHRTNDEGFEHPILQYVGRFMRRNELTKVIFNPDSHASLVSHSQAIIGFLAATFLYNDTDTDIIWNACMASVEAEFKRASFGVLTELCTYLDLDHLLYLAKKFADESPDKLGKDAVETLTDLFQKVQLKGGQTSDQDQERRLVTAFVSLEILYKVRNAEDTYSARQLRDTARNELLRFTTSEYDANDRVKIYQHCVPKLLQPADDSTTTIDILLLFLDSAQVFDHESQDLLSLLSVGTLVDELSYYVKTHHTGASQAEESTTAAIRCRIEAIIRLLALSMVPNSKTTMLQPALAAFTDCAVGRLAISNVARDCAWETLKEMAGFGETIGNTANEILFHCVKESISFPVELLTSNALRLQGIRLRHLSAGDILNNDFSLVLQDDTWKQLVQTAESTACPETSGLAREILCNILFDYSLGSSDKSKVSKCHADFTDQQIDGISRQFAALSPSNEEERRDINQKIDLLADVLRRSKQSADASKSTSIQDISLATEPASALLQCTLQVYEGGQTEPKAFRLLFNASTKLTELASKLPEMTGANTNRLLIGGQEIDLASQANPPMLELGIGDKTSVISICPKHTFQSDISTLLAPTGEVERQLVVHYDELEKLLDGPEEIAEKMCSFLAQVCPPPQPRQRVATAGQSARGLFPQDKVWRSAFTIHILKTHLNDYARLGVADGVFLLHGVDLLIEIITDEARQIEPVVFERAMGCLVLFLRERPSSPTTNVLIKSPLDFINSLIKICYFSLKCSSENGAVRRRMVKVAFDALMEAFRRQTSVWQAFTNHVHVVDLHQQVLLHSDTALADQIAFLIKMFFVDPSSEDGVTDFYMNTVLAILSHAMSSKSCVRPFFALATDTLSANKLLQTDEARAREICQSLVFTLDRYSHSESVDMPLVDMKISGMLKFLSEAISVVRSFKKPLDMGGQAVKIFTRFLFPLPDSYTPLVDQHSRHLAYSVVRSMCDSQADFAGLLAATSLTLQATARNPQGDYYGKASWQRPAWQCSGLRNLGQTCYMNSLLQQLFANVQFRKFIFETPITDPIKQDLLYQVQLLFANMQNTYHVYADTTELAKVLDIQISQQEDVHSFFDIFLGRLEANMPNEASRLTLSRFFTGSLISQTRGSCGHISSSEPEPFLGLPMVVKNKEDLQDSLNEMVQGEPMAGANKYKCFGCDSADGDQEKNGGRLVNAMKRSCPKDLPDNLTFCLKRFSFQDYGTKVNDRFEFPQTIDMSRWQLDRVETPSASVNQDMFELVGVIVHSGNLQSGHYWSYTLLRSTGVPESRNWVKLEDSRVSYCQGGIEEVQKECFGGRRKSGKEQDDSAYVLFYQRRESLEQQIAQSEPILDPATGFFLPSKVTIPTALEGEIHRSNEWRLQVDNVFDDDFHHHIQWMLSKYTRSASEPPLRSDGDTMDTSRPASSPQQERSMTTLVEDLSAIATTYIQQVLTFDLTPTAPDRLNQTVHSLQSLSTLEPYFASCVLRQIVKELAWFEKVVLHCNRKICVKTCELVLSCLAVVREHDETFYEEAFNMIKHAHSHVVRMVTPIHMQWDSYLQFAAKLAEAGSRETAAVLDAGYLKWAIMVLYNLIPNALGDITPLGQHMMKHPAKVSALFTFIHFILDLDVILPDVGNRVDVSNTEHEITAAGVVLSPNEVDLLSSLCDDQLLWMLCAREAEWGCDWKSFAPGKLMGLLLSPKYQQTFADLVAGSLESFIRNEEQSLDRLSHLVLHFCSNSEDQDSRSIFHGMAKTIHWWPKSELKFLATVREAHRLAPFSVVSSIEYWGARYLDHKSVQIRDTTEKWLCECVFKPDPISDVPELDSSRVSQTRKLVQLCVTTVMDARERNLGRAKFEQMINTMLAAEKFLKRANLAGKARGQSMDDSMRASVSTQLSFELAELPRHLDSLRNMREAVEEWNAEMLPASRMSLEPVSEFETDTDGEDGYLDDDGLPY